MDDDKERGMLVIQIALLLKPEPVRNPNGLSVDKRLEITDKLIKGRDMERDAEISRLARLDAYDEVLHCICGTSFFRYYNGVSGKQALEKLQGILKEGIKELEAM